MCIELSSFNVTQSEMIYCRAHGVPGVRYVDVKGPKIYHRFIHILQVSV